MTGYAWFVSQALRPNPGIYLPLQGGIMQGIIDMDGYAIQGLLDPVNPQDADTEAARDAAIAADILTHKGDASAHHIRYSDAEALAAAIAGGLSKVIWKDTPARVLADLNRTTGVAPTDIDLTAHTSATAKFALLFLQLHVNSYTNGDAWMGIRKNGTVPDYLYLIRAIDNPSCNHLSGLFGLLALDSGQVMEYNIYIAGTGQYDFYIDVMGYIE